MRGVPAIGLLSIGTHHWLNRLYIAHYKVELKCKSKYFDMIATLIGAGLAVGSSIWGGINASKAARKANRMLQGQKDSNNAWYRRRYNEDYADTAAGQRLITQAKDYAKESWKKAQGAAKVGGATDESAALAKEAGNKMVGNTISSIAASDTARKDRIDTAHRTTDNALTSQQVAVERDRANQITKAASQASNAMINAWAYKIGRAHV